MLQSLRFLHLQHTHFYAEIAVNNLNFFFIFQHLRTISLNMHSHMPFMLCQTDCIVYSYFRSKVEIVWLNKENLSIVFITSNLLWYFIPCTSRSASLITLHVYKEVTLLTCLDYSIINKVQTDLRRFKTCNNTLKIFVTLCTFLQF